jgi:O-antigen ligase
MTTAQSFAPYIPQELEPPPLLKMSFVCFCIFNLAFYSRFFEWHLWWLHVPLITSSIALAGAAIEGRLLGVFGTRIGICMAILTVLYAVNVPFSSWRSASLTVFTGEWLKALTAFAIAGTLIFNFGQCRTALHSIGWGSGIAGLLVNWKGQVVDGRLALGRGTLGNANEIAFDLLLGLPFLWLMLKDSRSGKLKKLVVASLIVNSIVAMLRTGSRGGLIGFAVLTLLLFIRTSIGGKVLMACAAILLVVGGLILLPNSLKLRYATIFSGSDAAQSVQNLTEARHLEEATSSSAGRRQLLINSLKVTMSHPIFGCGIGQFGTYMAGIESAAGIHSGWQGTHNTYTQISSEAGIPALIVFVSMLAFSLNGVRALSKRAKRTLQRGQQILDVINVAFALTATLVVYSVCVCFDYVAYSAILPVLAGFVIALMRCGNLELDRLERGPVQFVNIRPVRAPYVQLVGS